MNIMVTSLRLCLVDRCLLRLFGFLGLSHLCWLWKSEKLISPEEKHSCEHRKALIFGANQNSAKFDFGLARHSSSLNSCVFREILIEHRTADSICRGAAAGILFGIRFCNKGRAHWFVGHKRVLSLAGMTTNRYGMRNYDDDPVWATQNNSYDYQPRHVSPYSTVPHAHSVIGGAPPNNVPQQTTIVHSSIKPVPDSDIYR